MKTTPTCMELKQGMCKQCAAHHGIASRWHISCLKALIHVPKYRKHTPCNSPHMLDTHQHNGRHRGQYTTLVHTKPPNLLGMNFLSAHQASKLARERSWFHNYTTRAHPERACAPQTAA
eukprot:1136838-Pelagomonas_calceolata.AAC.3